jgi:hypothetical protein
MRAAKSDFNNSDSSVNLADAHYNYNSIKLVRALEIDPNRQTIRVLTISNLYEAIRAELGGRPKVCHHMPSGNRLYAMTDSGEGASFSIGCSLPIVGPALIVGKRGKGGMYESSFADLDAVTKIVTFINADRRH